MAFLFLTVHVDSDPPIPIYVQNVYNTCMMTGLFVTATTQRRRAEWERVFGTDQLPVTHRAPSLSPAGCLVYTLDTARLHWMQVNRVVHWLARRDGLTSAHARALVMAGLPIPASDVSLVQEQDISPAPVFVLAGHITRPFLC